MTCYTNYDRILYLMRKLFYLFFILLPLTFISCTNAGNTKLSYSDVETIKDTVKEREAQISWTKELEGNRLTENLIDTSKIDKEIKYTHQLAKIQKAKQDPVYPEYPNFGLLDSRLLSFTQKETINNLCEALSSDFYNKPLDYFDNQYIFNLVFFRNEFSEDWKKYFKYDFPQLNPQDEKTAANNPKKSTSKKESTDQAKITPLFTKWQLGEPFIGSEITQVPVRFYCLPGIVDVTLYLNKKNLIYKIEIQRWEKL